MRITKRRSFLMEPSDKHYLRASIFQKRFTTFYCTQGYQQLYVLCIQNIPTRTPSLHNVCSYIRMYVHVDSTGVFARNRCGE